jgi:hypothetical protein
MPIAPPKFQKMVRDGAYNDFFKIVGGYIKGAQAEGMAAVLLADAYDIFYDRFPDHNRDKEWVSKISDIIYLKFTTVPVSCEGLRGQQPR